MLNGGDSTTELLITKARYKLNMKVFREDLLCPAKGSNYSGIVNNTMKEEIKRINTKIAKLTEQTKIAVSERHIFAYFLLIDKIDELIRQKVMIKEYFKKK